MQVKTLLAQLQLASPEAEISIAVDEEGNDYKPIEEVVYVGSNRVENAAGVKVKGYVIYPMG